MTSLIEVSKDVTTSVVATLLIILGFSSSNSLYMDSHEEEPLSGAHLMSEKNGRISVTYEARGARFGGAMVFVVFFAAFDISEECFFSALACSKKSME